MVENYDIRIKEDGSRVVIRSLEDLAASADKAHEAADRLIKRLQAMSRLSSDRVNAYGAAWATAAKQMNEAADAAERLSRATANIKTPRPSTSGPAGTSGGSVNYPLATVGAASNSLASAAASSGGGGGLILRGGNKFMGMVEEVTATSRAMETLKARTFEVRDGFDRVAQSAIPSLTGIQQALAGVFAYLAVDKIIQYADAWAMLAGRMAVTSKTEEDAIYMTERLYDVAQRTRTPIQEMSALYQNLNIASKNLGSSQNDMLRFTELVGAALAVQKVPAATARGALLQLGQALDNGKVKAQEFNSIVMGIPYIMKIVAENFKGANGNIAAMRAHMNTGTFTSKELFDTLMAGSAQIEKDFAKTRQTFAQSFIVMENAAAKYFGQLNEGLGISTKFAAATKYIAENIETIGNVALVAAVGIGAMLAPAALGGLVTLVGGAAVAIAAIAGPVGIVLGLVAAAAAALTLFGNELQLGTKHGAGLRDLIVAMWDDAVKSFNGMWDTAVKFISPIGKLFDDVFGDVSITFGDVYMFFAKTIDYIVGAAVAGTVGIIAAFDELPNVVPNIFKDMYNQSVDVLERWGEKMLKVMNEIRVAAGKPVIVGIKTEKFDIPDDYMVTYMNHIKGAISHGFALSSHQVQDATKRMFDAADEIAKKRQKQVPPDLNVRTTPSQVNEDGKGKGYEKAEKALRSLIQQVAPAYAATLQLEHAEDVLNQAVAKGILLRDKKNGKLESANFYMSLVRKHYEDIQDPMSKFMRDLSAETELLELDTRERQVAQIVQREMIALRKSGIQLDEQELAMRKLLIELTVKENEEAKRKAAIRDAALAGSAPRQMQDLKEQLSVMQQLQAAGKLSQTDAFNQATQKTGTVELFAGTEDARQAELARYQDMYAKIDAMRQGEVVSEQAAAQAKMKVTAMEAEFKMSTTMAVLGNLATLMKSGNRKAFEVGKAAAVAEATISGVLAVQKALSSAPPPWNYALAAAVGVSAAMNVSKIMSATPGFEAGGYTGNYGRSQVAGVVHGQEYVVNADATARNRPLLEAMNSGGAIGGGNTYISTSIQISVSEGGVSGGGADTDFGLELQQAVEATVMRVIHQEKRQGGALSK